MRSRLAAHIRLCITSAFAPWRSQSAATAHVSARVDARERRCREATMRLLGTPWLGFDTGALGRHA